jgi:hypothetical protein
VLNDTTTEEDEELEVATEEDDLWFKTCQLACQYFYIFYTSFLIRPEYCTYRKIYTETRHCRFVIF